MGRGISCLRFGFPCVGSRRERHGRVAALREQDLPAVPRRGQDDLWEGEVPEESTPTSRRSASSTPAKVEDSVHECLSRATSTMTSSLRRTDSASDDEIPMWVCDISDIKLLGEMRAHETVEAMGLLTELQDAEGQHASFFSHKWTGFAHPDPCGSKYKLMCDLIEAAHLGSETGIDEKSREGGVKHCLMYGYAWLDFWSIPQADLDRQAAFIDQITCFVQRCSLFVVLAPPCLHADTGETVDFGTWESRGWCRLEALANSLSEDPAPVLLLDSPKFRLLPSSWDASWATVGDGTFSCCELGHVLRNGKRICCDKERVANMVSTMIDRAAKTAEESGDLASMRRVASSRRRLTRGLPTEEGSSGFHLGFCQLQG